MIAAIVAALALVFPAPINAPAAMTESHIEAFCKGCGCRGGPGWRIHRTGQCAGHKNIDKECGRPPSPALCTKEN
jgi:hypothetical protein